MDANWRPAAVGVALRSSPDSKQTHVAPRSSLTGVFADAGRLAGDGIFNSFHSSMSVGSPNRYA